MSQKYSVLVELQKFTHLLLEDSSFYSLSIILPWLSILSWIQPIILPLMSKLISNHCGNCSMGSEVCLSAIPASYPWALYRHSLQWRHNEGDSVSNHQPHDCLLNRLFGRRSKKTSKLCVTGEFPTQTASNAKNVSIWWRHHVRVGWHAAVPESLACGLLSFSIGKFKLGSPWCFKWCGSGVLFAAMYHAI